MHQIHITLTAKTQLFLILIPSVKQYGGVFIIEIVGMAVCQQKDFLLSEVDKNSKVFLWQKYHLFVCRNRDIYLFDTDPGQTFLSFLSQDFELWNQGFAMKTWCLPKLCKLQQHWRIWAKRGRSHSNYSRHRCEYVLFIDTLP